MKFAHLSDIHLGFQKDEPLQQIEQDIFEKTINECISRRVDFVLIPGDMFHTNIPEMRVQKFAFANFRRLYDAQIPVYVVYGSHDFSPVSNSVIDLLAQTGYIIKVTIPTSNEDGTICLDFVTDPKTGIKIAGLPGLKVGKEKEWYEKLDRGPLESESGPKIFLFHGAISDMKTELGTDMEYMPLSLLPKGFAYYAGGHLHKFNHQEFADYPHVVYPGTLFAGYYTDLEENAKGQKRGFVIVEMEDSVKSVEFIPADNSEYNIIEIDANNRKSESVNQELLDQTKGIDPRQKIVIVKIQGELTSGKTSEVNISAARESILNKGALSVKISKNQLTSKEYSITKARGDNKDEIETNTFLENIGQLRLSQERLLGEQGVSLAKDMLHALHPAILTNETKVEYSARILDHALQVLGVRK